MGDEPLDCSLGARTEALGNHGKSCRDDRRFYQAGIEQRADKVLILLAQGAQRGGADVLLVETSIGELRLARWRRGVDVLA